MPCFCILSMKLEGHLFVSGSNFYKLLSYYRTHIEAFITKKRIKKSSLHRAEQCCLPAKYPTLRLFFLSPSTTCSLARLPVAQACFAKSPTVLSSPGLRLRVHVSSAGRCGCELLDARTVGQSLEMSGSFARREPLAGVSRSLASSQAWGKR